MPLRSLIKFACALALGPLLVATAHAQTALDDVMARMLLVVAIPTASAPYGYVGTNLALQGLDIDMANLIGARLGVKVELVAVTSASRIPYLQTKKADLVISTLGKNPKREKVIDFTISYSPFFQAIFGSKTLLVKTPTDLAGKTVGVARGAMEDQEVGKIAPAGVDIKRFEDMNGTVSAYAAGQVQLMGVGASVAGNFMAKNPQVSTEFKLLLKDSPNYIGVAKGEDSAASAQARLAGAGEPDHHRDAGSRPCCCATRSRRRSTQSWSARCRASSSRSRSRA